MEKRKEMLGQAPIGRLLFRLALPTVVAQLVNVLYNIVDRIYIGRMSEVGDLALTGVGVCLPIILIVSAFAALVGSGGAPRASILLGKRKTEEGERILGNCFAFQLVLSALLTAILLLFGRGFLMAFGASENTIGYAADYLRIYAVGTVFVQLTLGLNAFITAQGFTGASMLSVVIGAVANIALDPLLIYGLGMGVRGAALATVISQALSCAWCLLFLCGRRATLRLRWKHIRLCAQVILPCLGLGAATFVMQASESVISVCFNASLLRYGGDVAVGAMTILSSVMQFAMLPLLGIAQGAQPILSYNYGAGNGARIKRTFLLLLCVCVGYSMLLGACVMALPGVFASMFTDVAHLHAFTVSVIRIYFAGIFLFGVQTACQMAFVSLGNAPASVLVAVVRKFVLLLPLIYVLPHLMKAMPTTAVFLAEPIADTLAVCFTATLFAFQFKKVLKGLGPSGGLAQRG